MNYLPLYLARKLPLRSGSRGSTTSFVVAVAGISLAIIVMMISISVMLGFKDEVRSKIFGFDAQIIIAANPTQESQVPPTITMAELSDVLSSLPSHARASLTSRQPAILKAPENFSGVIFKGAGQDYDWSFVESNLVEGKMPDYSADSTLYHIVISRKIADDLTLSLEDKVDAFFIGDGTYRMRRLKIAGIYDTHFSEYDRNIIFSNLQMIRNVADISTDSGALIEISGLSDDDEIDLLSEAISVRLLNKLYAGETSRQYSVINIHDSAALYFNWLALLDTNVVVILALMAVLAALTLVSSLFILVLRRVPTIGILRALGASESLVRRTFILLTLRLLLAGLILGNVVGLGLIYLQKATGLVPLDPEAYYLDHVPVTISWLSIGVMNLSAVVIAFAVLLIPSAIIATISPARVINYE